MRRKTVLLIGAASVIVLAIATYAAFITNAGGGATPEPASLIAAAETSEVVPRGEINDLLSQTACLVDCAVSEITQDPFATDSCLVTFHVWHLDQDEEDPDCCLHGAPSSVKFYIFPAGGAEDDYTLSRGAHLYGMGYSCYVYNYEKTLSLLDGQTYYYRFAHESESGCRCPPGGTDEEPIYAYIYVDCRE